MMRTVGGCTVTRHAPCAARADVAPCWRRYPNTIALLQNALESSACVHYQKAQSPSCNALSKRPFAGLEDRLVASDDILGFAAQRDIPKWTPIERGVGTPITVAHAWQMIWNRIQNRIQNRIHGSDVAQQQQYDNMQRQT